MALNPNSSELDIIVRTEDETTVKIKQIESSIIRFVGAVSSALSALSVAVFPIREASEFQKELLNVAKTTDFTETQIAVLSRRLIELSGSINLSASELARISAIAGQLGLGRGGVEGIAQFTETTARFAAVLDITVEQAGNGLAQLQNVFKVNVEEVERISSLINELSNNSVASGEQLIDIVNRIGTAGGTLRIDQAAALAALGRDLGISVETVGTSFQKIFLNLQTNSNELASVIGIPVERFATLVRTDGVEALKLALRAIQQLDKGIQAAFAERVFGGGRIFGLVTNLLNDKDFKLLDDRLEVAKRGFDSGTSSINEMNRVSQGLRFQLQLLRNAISAIAIEVGEQALPALTAFAREFQQALRDPVTIDKFLQVGAAIGDLALAFVDLIRFVSRFSVLFGPLLRLLEVFIGIRILGFVFNLGVSFRNWTREVRNATVAFAALASGQKAVQTAVAQTAAATAAARQQIQNAAQVSPFASFVGGTIGAPIVARRAQQEAIAASEKRLAQEKLALTQATAIETGRIAVVRGEILAMEGRSLALESLIAAGERDRARGLQTLLTQQLASNRAKLATQQLEITTHRQLLAQLEAELILRTQLRNQAVAQLTVESARVVASAGIAQRALAGLGAFMIGIGRVVAAGFRFLFLNPIGLIISTIAFMVASMAGWTDSIVEFFARIVGVSGTAAQQAQQHARIREREAKREADQVKQLSDQYTRLRAQIEAFNPETLNQAVRNGTLVTYLQSVSRNIDVVQAKIRTLAAEIARFEESRVIANQGASRVGDQIAEQEAKVSEIEQRLARAVSLNQQAQASGAGGILVAGLPEGVRLLTQELESARSRLAALRGEQQNFANAQASLANQQVRAQGQLFGILRQEANLLSGIGPLYTDQVNTLFEKAAVIADVRERIVGLRAEIKDLESKGVDTGDDVKARQQLIGLRQQASFQQDLLRSLVEEHQTALSAAGDGVRAILEHFGNAATRSGQQIRDTAQLMAEAFAADGKGPLSQGLIATEEKIADLEEQLKGFNAEREKIRQGSQLGNLVTFRRDRSEVDLDIAKAQRELEQQRQNRIITQTRIEQAKELRQLSESQRVNQDQVRNSIIASGLAAGALKTQYENAAKAQRIISSEAKSVADAFKAEYERAANAAAAAVLNASNVIVRFQQRIRNAATDLQLIKFDEAAQRRQRDSGNVVDLITEEMEKQLAISKELGETQDEAIGRLQNGLIEATRLYERELDVTGVTGERRRSQLALAEQFGDRIIDIYRQERFLTGQVGALNEGFVRRQIAFERERFESIQRSNDEVARGTLEFAAAQNRAATAQTVIESEMQRQIQIQEELRKAIENKDDAEIKRLTEKGRVSSAVSRQALEELEQQIQKVEELGARQVTGEFIQTTRVVDTSTTQTLLQQLADVQKNALGVIRETQRGLADSSALIAKQASEALQETETRLKDIEAALRSAAQVTGIAVEAFVEAGKQLLRISTVAQETEAIITRIREGGVERTADFPDSRILSDALNRSKAQVQFEAQALAETISQSLASGISKGLAQSFTRVTGVEVSDETLTNLRTRVESSLSAINASIDSGKTFDKLQEEVGKKELTIPAKIVPSGGSASVSVGQFAGGGAVVGPGTSTSDSILARLSSGEYVSDAFTVRTFGPGFFAFLKKMARGGSGLIGSFLSTFSSLPLPKFSGGGAIPRFAGGGLAAAGAGTSFEKMGVLDITAEGRPIGPIFGDRDVLRGVANAMKKLSKGTRR